MIENDPAEGGLDLHVEMMTGDTWTSGWLDGYAEVTGSPHGPRGDSRCPLPHHGRLHSAISLARVPASLNSQRPPWWWPHSTRVPARLLLAIEGFLHTSRLFLATWGFVLTLPSLKQRPCLQAGLPTWHLENARSRAEGSQLPRTGPRVREPSALQKVTYGRGGASRLLLKRCNGKTGCSESGRVLTVSQSDSDSLVSGWKSSHVASEAHGAGLELRVLPEAAVLPAAGGKPGRVGGPPSTPSPFACRPVNVPVGLSANPAREGTTSHTDTP